MHVGEQGAFYLDQPVWRIIDHSAGVSAFDAIDSFAADEALCQAVGSGASPTVCRLWVHGDTAVLGAQDGRLARAEAGIAYLQRQGYRVIVRNSGGLAVVLDRDVLNISLILPVSDVYADIDDGFRTMQFLIEAMLRSYRVNVAAREIAGSYCPGRYDLSIGGRKFGGISQRRMQGGMAVQVFLLAAGSGARRAEVVKHFYDIAGRGETSPGRYPTVLPYKHASLAELIGEGITVEALKDRLRDVMCRHAGDLVETGLSPGEEDDFLRYRQRLTARNEQMIGYKAVR